MSLNHLVKKLPNYIKQPLKYIYGAVPAKVRYGKVFRDTYNFLDKSQWWSREKLEEYQVGQLTALLHRAYTNVPYYTRIFDEYGLRPEDIRDFNDLKKIPYLTKDIINENFSELVDKNITNSKLEYVTTGGSTGIPLGFYYEKDIQRAKESAFIWQLWNRIGYKMGDRCAVLRGDIVESTKDGKFWKYDPINRYIVLSSYHLTDKLLPQYIEKIRNYKPHFIQAYPSAITILADFMKKNNIGSFQSIKAILCGSENLYSGQRKLIEEAFQCRLFSWYGNSEQTVLAGECERSTSYHIYPEYGFVELIGKNDIKVNEEGESGEVVATSLMNFVMPLIRYKTDDIAVHGGKNCSCGRNYKLLKTVEGRLQELIVTSTGRRISMVAINMHSDVFDNVKQFQFYQEKEGEVFFNVVKKNSYTEKDTEYIRKELVKKLGDDMTLEIRFVDDIPRTKSGKYRFLIQKLPIKFSD